MVTVWTLNSDSEVLLEDLDDFLACYVAATGETHMLDAFPAEILRRLASTPSSREQIIRHLATLLGEQSGDWIPKIDGILAELKQLQLIDSGIT
jgi:PqqD family protein of HPr-rel-A system